VRVAGSLPLALILLALAGCEDLASDRNDGAASRVASGDFVGTPDGEQIHYLRRGERTDPTQPALLFVPGWTMAAEVWEPQLGAFSETHLVVAMDPRSQGRSSKARDGHHAWVRAGDIRAVVEELELEPVVLVGWSMAVTEVVAYVDRYGTDGVSGLVLVDGVAGQDLDPDLALIFMQWTADFVHDREAATREFVRGMYRQPHPEAYLDEVVEQALRTPTDAAAALIVGTVGNDFRSTLPGIDRPVLVAATTGSPWDPIYEEMTAQLPDARLEWFPEAGHALFVDDAPGFNQLLEGFLEGLPEVRATAPGEGSPR
jgi:non-heme chloroperoxidase